MGFATNSDGSLPKQVHAVFKPRKIQLCLGRPGLRRAGVTKILMGEIIEYRIRSLTWDLRRCPMNLNFLVCKIALTVVWGRWLEATSSTLALVHVLSINVGGMFKIWRKYFCWKIFSLLRWFAFSRMEPAIFTAELRVRLGIAEATADTWCPKCDAVLDTQGYHSGMCMAGGERVLRHNALRDLVFSWAERGCLRPERKKPGLLLPNNQVILAVPGADRQMSSSRPSLDVQLHLILLSQLLSDWTPWDLVVEPLLLKPTLRTNASTLTLLLLVPPRMWLSCPWSSKLLGPGALKRLELWATSAGLLGAPALVQRCCKKLAYWFGAGELELPCAGALS